MSSTLYIIFSLSDIESGLCFMPTFDVDIFKDV
jgi:hypothetical protein